jgi:hypothetical protein
MDSIRHWLFHAKAQNIFAESANDEFLIQSFCITTVRLIIVTSLETVIRHEMQLFIKQIG